MNDAWTAMTGGTPIQEALDAAQEELMVEIEDYSM
jgi:hypothetical protein